MMFAAPEELAVRWPGRYRCAVCGASLNYYPMGIMLCGQGMCDACFGTCFDEASSYHDYHGARDAWMARFTAARRRIQVAVRARVKQKEGT